MRFRRFDEVQAIVIGDPLGLFLRRYNELAA
jgi:hypothetical protein